MTRSRIINFSFGFILLVALFAYCVPNAKAAGASLYFSPSTGTYEIGGTFKIAVKVNSGGEEINAAEGSISYDADILEATGVSKGSLFMFWTTEPKAGGGSIKFGGGNPSPYKGAAGNVLTISFKAKKLGTAQVRFTSGAVLANDGKGTNILASMGSGNYTVSAKEIEPKTEVTTKPATDTNKPKEETKPEPPEVETDYNLPLIKSASHPDTNIWYQSGDVKLSWDLPKGVTDVSLLFDNKPTSVPGNNSDGLIGEKAYNNTEGGIWYFHLKYKDAKKWGTVAHFRIMIDKNPPNSFKINVKNIEVGNWPVLEFETKDGESGLDRYEVYVGSLEQQAHTLDALKNSIQLSDLEPGTHTVLLKAIDKAGNQRVETVEFVIDPIPTPVIVNFSAEVKPSDKFYMNGTAMQGATVIVYLEQDNRLLASTSVAVDANGNWFYLNPEKLTKGRFTAYAKAVNDKGMKSGDSSRVSFIVSPPIFAEIGAFIIDYFTVIVSLLFMTILIVIIIFFFILFVRKKLKKETIEVEEVVKRNLNSFRNEMEEEFKVIIEKETRVSGRKDKMASRAKLRTGLDSVEKKIMKEVKDVEDILK